MHSTYHGVVEKEGRLAHLQALLNGIGQDGHCARAQPPFLNLGKHFLKSRCFRCFLLCFFFPLLHSQILVPVLLAADVLPPIHGRGPTGTRGYRSQAQESTETEGIMWSASQSLKNSTLPVVGSTASPALCHFLRVYIIARRWRHGPLPLSL